MKLLNCDLASAVAESMRLHPVPGLTTAAIRGGKIAESCALGVRDDLGTPMTEDTLFEAASLTKSLFATLFLRACDRGTVTLDRSAYVQGAPRWSGDPRFDVITPRMALCHASGLPNWAAQPMELLFAPNSSYSYSGDGYYLLQHLLEHKTGLSFPALAQQELLTPWQLGTEVVWTPEVGARMSCGFDEQGVLFKRRDAIDEEGLAPEPNAAWSLYANARIYAGFLCRMMNEHGGLQPETFDEMTSPQNRATPGILWGLGFGIPDADRNVLWHWGDNSGFKSFAIWDKATRDGLTVFTNSDAGLDCYLDLCGRMTDGTFFPAIRDFIVNAE